MKASVAAFSIVFATAALEAPLETFLEVQPWIQFMVSTPPFSWRKASKAIFGNLIEMCY